MFSAPNPTAQRCVSCGGIVKMADCPACKVAYNPNVPRDLEKCHACNYIQVRDDEFNPPDKREMSKALGLVRRG